jgi:hypothetical protein
VREVKSAGDIVREMMEEAEAVLSRLAERYAGLRKAP